MCRSALEYPPNGKRCEKVGDEAHQKARRDARNARRREQYAAAKANAESTTVPTVKQKVKETETADVSSIETNFFSPESLSAYEDIRAEQGLEPLPAEIRDEINAISQRMVKDEQEFIAFTQGLKSSFGKDLTNQTLSEEDRKRLIEENKHIGRRLRSLQSGLHFEHEQIRELYTTGATNKNPFRDHERMLKLLSTGSADNYYIVGGPKNVDLEGLNFRDRHFRLKLITAGAKYPGNWDEMGSSEKDMWEERTYATLLKFSKK